MEKSAWRISCPKNNFEKIKSDETFLGLLSLARCVNALRFCQTSLIDAKDSETPSKARTTINSVLFACSVLYEGFLLIEKIGGTYKDTDSFKNGFGVLLKDRKIRSFREKTLYKVRNKLVFHFDKAVPKEAIENFNSPVINFASGVGKAAGEMYFDLADELSIHYLLQSEEEDNSDKALKLRYIEILKETTDIMEKFFNSAEILMADVLRDMI